VQTGAAVQADPARKPGLKGRLRSLRALTTHSPSSRRITKTVTWTVENPCGHARQVVVASVSRRIRPDHVAPSADPETTVWVSAATVWEIGIKQSLGKPRFSAPISESRLAAEFGLLPVAAQPAEVAGALGLHHRDPFDRMSVAQAQIEQMAMLTVDPVFDAFDVATV